MPELSEDNIIETLSKFDVSDRYKYFESLGIPLSIVARVDLEVNPRNCASSMLEELTRHNCSFSNLSQIPSPVLKYSEQLFRKAMVSQRKRAEWLRQTGLDSGHFVLSGSPLNFLSQAEQELEKHGKNLANLI